ncbi:MAG: hypothetical protein A2Y33_13720 [Spirochaetes bacterium GWF1_51_8]|nr:MAG: hypothetical protein A2Y33_13720 [Spirochaetes bacterium GWF1_51_8]
MISAVCLRDMNFNLKLSLIPGFGFSLFVLCVKRLLAIRLVTLRSAEILGVRSPFGKAWTLRLRTPLGHKLSVRLPSEAEAPTLRLRLQCRDKPKEVFRAENTEK